VSAPVVVSVQPNPSETDVVLGQQIIITFDQVIDTSTLDESTFSLTYPAPAQVINAQNLISGNPAPSTVVVQGTWTFTTNSSNQTVATFTPKTAFQQNTLYTAMLLGTDAALTSADIQNTSGQAMATSYSWSFTTGVLNLETRSLRPAGSKSARARARKSCPWEGGLPPHGSAEKGGYLLGSGSISEGRIVVSVFTLAG